MMDNKSQQYDRNVPTLPSAWPMSFFAESEEWARNNGNFFAESEEWARNNGNFFAESEEWARNNGNFFAESEEWARNNLGCTFDNFVNQNKYQIDYANKSIFDTLVKKASQPLPEQKKTKD